MTEQNRDEIVNQQLIRLASDRPQIYRAAQAWFMKQGPEITRSLVQGLSEERLGSVGHSRILQLLRHFAQEETLPAVLNAFHLALERKDPIVLPAAMEALAVFRNRAAVDILVALLEVDNLDIVKHAAALVGGTGDLKAVEPLFRLLESEDPSIRYSAARGLTQFDHPSIRAALGQHLVSETNAEVRELIESAGMEDSNEGD